MITCQGVYFFSEPNQILIALIGLRKANLKTETLAGSCFRKKLFLKNSQISQERNLMKSFLEHLKPVLF